MRPAFRIVPVTLAAFVASLAVASASGTHPASPDPHPKRPTVNAVPYIAPWQAGFEKFATQVYTAKYDIAQSFLSLTVPDGQWWRVIYLAFGMTPDANAGNRTILVQFFVRGDSVTSRLSVVPPVSQPTGTDYQYLFGPGLTSYANVTDPQTGMAVASLPDVLWPGGTELRVTIGGAFAGDRFDSRRNYAVEIYTEERPGVLIPLTPTPLVP